jgi:hypothetical protein
MVWTIYHRQQCERVHFHLSVIDSFPAMWRRFRLGVRLSRESEQFLGTCGCDGNAHRRQASQPASERRTRAPAHATPQREVRCRASSSSSSSSSSFVCLRWCRWSSVLVVPRPRRPLLERERARARGREEPKQPDSRRTASGTARRGEADTTAESQRRMERAARSLALALPSRARPSRLGSGGAGRLDEESERASEGRPPAGRPSISRHDEDRGGPRAGESGLGAAERPRSPRCACSGRMRASDSNSHDGIRGIADADSLR